MNYDICQEFVLYVMIRITYYDRIKIELREKNYQIKRKDTSEENSEKATYLKLAEVLCESIPQVKYQLCIFNIDVHGIGKCK